MKKNHCLKRVNFRGQEFCKAQGLPNRTSGRKNAKTSIAVETENNVLSIKHNVSVTIIIIVGIGQWSIIAVFGIVWFARL